MNLENFTAKFADQFDNTDSSEIKSNTIYKDLDEWDSIMAMLIIGFIKTEYGINVTNVELVKSDTVQDLFNYISIK